jgi:hypothetical protein
MRDGMIVVRIAVPGCYNDGDGKAADYAVGDELETHEWYARGLVAEGLAEWPVMPVEEAIAVEEAGGSEFAGVLPNAVVAEMARRGVWTVADLRERTDSQLLKIPGLGTGRLKTLRQMARGKR